MEKDDGWTKKSKGNAKIYMHADAPDGRAIVENHRGISFNGKIFDSVLEAKNAALSLKVSA